MNPHLQATIVKKLRRSPVYQAVGDALKTAMIAEEVMSVLYAQDDMTISIEGYADLYGKLRHELMPDVYGAPE